MQIEIKFYNIITREYVEATDTSNANDIKNLKKLNPNKLYKNKNSPISIVNPFHPNQSQQRRNKMHKEIFHKASTIEMDSRIETRSWISIALSPAYFVGEATFARHRDKYIKTGGEFVSDDDSVGSRARLSGPSPP